MFQFLKKRASIPIIIILIIVTIAFVAGEIAVYQTQWEHEKKESVSNEIIGWKMYKNEAYGIKFEYPDNYVIEVENENHSYLKTLKGIYFIGLRPQNWFDSEVYKNYEISDHPLYIIIHKLSFKESAEAVGFSKKGNVWTLSGGIHNVSPEPVGNIEMDEWRGIYGSTNHGCYNRNGRLIGRTVFQKGKSIGCYSDYAIIGADGDYCVSLSNELSYINSSEGIFDHILSTFRFLD